MKSPTFGRGKGRGDVEILTTDLKALLFWASVGVSKSRGGSYEADIENIIESLLDYLGIIPSQFLGSPAKFLTEEQYYAKKFASDGGKARAKSLSKKERSAHAKKMVTAREAKRLPPAPLIR